MFHLYIYFYKKLSILWKQKLGKCLQFYFQVCRDMHVAKKIDFSVERFLIGVLFVDANKMIPDRMISFYLLNYHF